MGRATLSAATLSLRMRCNWLVVEYIFQAWSLILQTPTASLLLVLSAMFSVMVSSPRTGSWYVNRTEFVEILGFFVGVLVARAIGFFWAGAATFLAGDLIVTSVCQWVGAPRVHSVEKVMKEITKMYRKITRAIV